MNTVHPTTEQIVGEAVKGLEQALHFTQPGLKVFVPDASVLNRLVSSSFIAAPIWIEADYVYAAIAEGKRIIATEVARKLK